MNFRFLVLSLIAFSGPFVTTSLLAAQVTIVKEQFADGNRSEDAPPESLNWFYTSPGSAVVGLRVSGNQLILIEDRRNAEGLSSVVAHFARQEIQAGSSIILSFAFTVEGTLASSYFGLRFGLFDSNGSSKNRYVEDAQVILDNDSSGYAATINPATGQMRVLERRLGQEPGDLINMPYESFKKEGGGPYVQLGAAAEGVGGLKVGERYRATMKIVRTGMRSVSVEASVTGEAAGSVATINQKDRSTSTVVSAFDTVAIGINGKTINQLTLSDIEIIHEQ